MKPVLCVYKPVGKTPLEMITLFKEKYPLYSTEKIGYAGRLDPMAEGLLLLLIGNENKRKERYESLDKTYEFDLLIGISTDTYDTLGMISKIQYPTEQQLESFPSLLKDFLGKYKQSFPPYSSKSVHGKPLYWWARRNRLNEIALPKKVITIHTLFVLAKKSLSLRDLTNTTTPTFELLNGDFRQKEIRLDWQAKAKEFTKPLPVFTITALCSSGTYIRSLCHDIGEKLGCGGIAIRIKRTQVGEFREKDALYI